MHPLVVIYSNTQELVCYQFVRFFLLDKKTHCCFYVQKKDQYLEDNNNEFPCHCQSKLEILVVSVDEAE
jgi:hypothetical protein